MSQIRTLAPGRRARCITVRHISWILLSTSAVTLVAAGPASSQISLGPFADDENTVCHVGTTLQIAINDDCSAGLTGVDYAAPSTLSIGPAGSQTVFNPTNGTATFGAASTFNAAATFNGAATFNSAITTNGVTNTGNMATGTLSTSGVATLNSLSVTNNASIGGTLSVSGLASFNGGVAITGGTTTDTLVATTSIQTPILNATTANIGTANVTTATIGTANVATGNIGTANVTTATIGTANVTTATIGTANVATATIGTANVTTGNIGTANVMTANIVTANAATGNIGTANVTTALNVSPGATINMGGNRLMNVAAPVAGTDAANKSYVDANVGVVASDVATLSNRVDRELATVNTRLADLGHRSDQAFSGVAMAFAMAGVPTVGRTNEWPSPSTMAHSRAERTCSQCCGPARQLHAAQCWYRIRHQREPFGRSCWAASRLVRSGDAQVFIACISSWQHLVDGVDRPDGYYCPASGTGAEGRPASCRGAKKSGGPD